MQQITPIPEFKPVLGDDVPWVTERYERIPHPYRFDDLDWSRLGEDLQAIWKNVLTSYLDRHYAKWELNAQGITLTQWFEGLQESLDANIDNLKKLLNVYDDDIMLPILGRTITRTRTESGSENFNEGEQSTTGTESTARHYDLPVDNEGATAYETSRDSTTPGAITVSGRQDSKSTSGNSTETEEWSDVGVRPNYETIEGFWKRNPTAQKCAAEIFSDDFIIHEYYW